jgi:hypothetical protein
MMLPKTACPDTLGAFNKTAQNRTAKPRTASRFAIPPLLADPFPVSFKNSIPTPIVEKLGPQPIRTKDGQVFRALSIWLNVTKGRPNQNSQKERARLNR